MKKPLYLGLAGLAVFYAFVASMVMRPNVSAEYAAYYIDKTSPLSVAEAHRIQPLVAGRRYGVDDKEIVFNEWSSSANGLRAPAWPAPKLYFELPAKTSGDVTLTVRPCLKDCRPMVVHVNDMLVFSGRLPPVPTWRFVVPSGLLHPGRNLVVFDVCVNQGNGACDFARALQVESLTYTVQ